MRKKEIPQDAEEKEELGATLSKYGVSLKEYQASLKTSVKRLVASNAVPSPRKSPRMSPSAAKRTLF